MIAVRWGKLKNNKRSILFIVIIFGIFNMQTIYAAANLSILEKYHVLEEKNIFNGMADGLPHFEKSTTRAELCKIVTNLFKLNVSKSAASYSDTVNHWAQIGGYIETSKENRLLMGRSDRLFDPEGKVTLEQLASVMVRGLQLPLVESKSSIESSLWARSNVATAIENRLISRGLNYKKMATRSDLVNVVFAASNYNNPLGVTLLSFRDVENRYKKSVVSVVSLDEKGATKVEGMGFVVSNNLIVTNYRTINHSERIGILNAKGEMYLSDGTVYIEGSKDLAILHLGGINDLEPLTLKQSKGLPAEKSQRVLLMGKTGLSGTIHGYIKQGTHNLIQLEMSEKNFLSALPLLDQSGEVIGISVVDKKNPTIDYRYAIPISDIIKTKIIWDRNEVRLFGTRAGLAVSEMNLSDTLLTNKGDLHVIWSSNETDNQVNLVGYIDTADYSLIYAPKYNEIKTEIYDMAEKWGDQLDQLYPEKKIELSIRYQTVYEKDPTYSFPIEQIEKVNDLVWNVDHLLIHIYLSEDHIKMEINP
jgi:hypothetical protein